MATKPVSPRPIWQHPLLVPGLFAVLALVFLVVGYGAFAFASLMAALGLFLYTMGKAKRWKGAPQAGMVVVAVGLFVAIWALLGG